MWPELVHPIE
jgi:hypothetical protein